MTYNLRFHEKALEEWKDLTPAVREQLKKKLEQRLVNPHVPGSRLRGQKNRYKIKLKRPGIRLVYEVNDGEVLVSVIAVGPRERSEVYRSARRRSV